MYNKTAKLRIIPLIYKTLVEVTKGLARNYAETISERHTDIEVETACARILEVVVPDVGQTDIIAQSEIEHLEAGPTANPQSTVKALEAGLVITETGVSLAVAIVLDLAADAQKLHSTPTMLTKKQDSAFLLSGPVYENDVRVDGYSHHDKFIKSGKILFVYSLTYPDSYKPAMPRLFHLIENWKVLGAN